MKSHYINLELCQWSNLNLDVVYEILFLVTGPRLELVASGASHKVHTKRRGFCSQTSVHFVMSAMTSRKQEFTSYLSWPDIIRRTRPALKTMARERLLCTNFVSFIKTKRIEEKEAMTCTDNTNSFLSQFFPDPKACFGQQTLRSLFSAIFYRRRE